MESQTESRGKNVKKIYKGVSIDKDMFMVRCNGNYYGSYLTLIHGAYAYNLAAQEEFGDNPHITNDVQKPEGFELCTRKNIDDKDIHRDETRKKQYRVRINRKYYGSYFTKEEAIIARNKIYEMLNEEKQRNEEMKM